MCETGVPGTLRAYNTPTIAAPGVGGDAGADTPGGVADGADGGDPMAASYSGGQVRYADGREYMTTSDLDPAEAGLVSGFTRTWSSDPARSADSSLGSGWFASQWPTLKQVAGTNDDIKAIDGGTSTRFFHWTGSAYASTSFSLDKLEVDGSGFKLTDTLGNVTYYNGFTGSAQGRATRYVDAGGNETVYTWSSGQLQRIQRKLGQGGSAQVLEQQDYTYDSVSGLLTDIALQRWDNYGALLPDTRNVHYAYDTNLRLSLATIRNGSAVVDYKHYRYDSAGRLIIILEGDSYERAIGAGIPDPSNATNASNDAIATYADLVFEYYPDGRLRKQTIQGMGMYEYAYAHSDNTDGVNNWKYKTFEYLPDDTATFTDNDEKIVYSNYLGEVLASVFVDKHDAGGGNWVTAYQYDDKGRLVLTAEPSAISGTINEANADIVSPILSGTNGLMYVTQYYASGSATAGYTQYQAIKHGSSGTLNKLVEYAYTQQRPGSQGFLITSQTTYQGEGNTNATTTGFAYTFYSGSGAVYQRTTHLPVVSAAQNGSGSSTDTVVEQFDTFGRVMDLTDGDGRHHATTYVNSTGAVATQTIDAAAGGLQLTTYYTSDGLGRTTQIVDPMGYSTTIGYVDLETYRLVKTMPPDTGAGTTRPPDSVTRYDRRLGISDTLTLAGGSNSVLSLTRQSFNPLGQLTATERYPDVLGVSYAQTTGVSVSGLRYRTEYAYDARGNPVRVSAGRDLFSGSMAGTNPTITRTVYDALDRVVSTWIGTDDSGWTSTTWPGTNMTKVSENQYDAGGVGDSNLTQTTQFPNDGSANRVTRMLYDWRDQLTTVKSGVQTYEATTVNRPLTVYGYDNLGRQISVAVCDGDSVPLGDVNSDGVPDALPTDSCRAWSESFYDSRGQVYRTLQHSINQASGVDEGALATDMWYDNRGNVIKTKSPGGLVSKAKYDGAGRVIKQYTTDGGGDPLPGAAGNYAAAGNVDGDVVLEQVETGYDSDGNPILVVSKQRWHNATNTGELGLGNARISLVGSWYDAADRLVTTVNYGNNGDDGQSFISGGKYVRPGSAPARDSAAISAGWDQWLRTDYQYDAAGMLSAALYPRTIVAYGTNTPRTDKYVYDALGRKITLFETYVNGVANATDADRTTKYFYNGFDQTTTVESLTFDGTQVRTLDTAYDYGVAMGSGISINNSSLLRQVRTYRSSGGTQTTLQTQSVTGYNALGEVTQKTEANGSVHQYTINVLVQTISDEVVNYGSLPATMDKTTRRLRYAYDTLGRGVTFSSDGDALQTINEVKRRYDGLGNLVVEWQSHFGTVGNPDTSTAARVDYVFDTNFTSNYSRLKWTIYPDGRVVWTGYDDNALNNSISRPGYLADSNYDGSGNPTTPQDRWLDAYAYLGLSQVVVRDMNLPEFGGENSGRLTLSYFKDYLWMDPQKDDGGNSDPYDGQDRFGRVVSYGWDSLNTRTYGYDSDGNMLYAYAGDYNVNAKWRSELYSANSLALFPVTADTAYDRLGRLKEYQRGILSDEDSDGLFDMADRETVIDSVETHYRHQFWDETPNTGGNYDQVPNSLGDYDPENPKQRTTWQKQVPAGTFTRTDSPELTTDEFVEFDAWGRLAYKATATLQNVSGNTYTYDGTSDHPLDEQNFGYDALGRRITETHWVFTGSIPGVFRGTLHLYTDVAGNVLEERQQAVVDNPATTLKTQYVWSLAGPNLLVVCDQNTGHFLLPEFGRPGSGLDRRLWVEQGPDASVWQIRDNDDSLGLEQFLYTPEGQVQVLTFVLGTGYVAPNGNNNFSAYEFRYLWHGQRAEVFAEKSAATNDIVDKFDGLIWTGAGEQDTWRGGPVDEDVSAYARPGGGYDQWTPTAVNYPGNGTSGQWVGDSASTWDAFWNPSKYDAVVGTVRDPDEVGGWDFVPVVGSAMRSYSAFSRGDITSGIIYGLAGIGDISLVKSVGKMAIKTGAKVLATTAGRRVAVGAAAATLLAAQDADASTASIMSRFIGLARKAPAAFKSLEWAARAEMASLGIRTFRTQIMRGAAETGFEFGAILGRGKTARLIIAEAKDVTGAVRSGTLTAFGMGKGGRAILKRNIKELVGQIGQLAVDDATKKALMRQAKRGTYEVWLFGNQAKGTIFAPGVRSQLRVATGSGKTVVNLVTLP